MASQEEVRDDNRPRSNSNPTLHDIVNHIFTESYNLPIPQLARLNLLHDSTSSSPSPPELVSDHGTDSEANNKSEPKTESEPDTDSEPDTVQPDTEQPDTEQPDTERGPNMSDDGYDENGYA